MVRKKKQIQGHFYGRCLIYSGNRNPQGTCWCGTGTHAVGTCKGRHDSTLSLMHFGVEGFGLLQSKKRFLG